MVYMTDTKYQRAKIIAEEMRKFYFQALFFIGIFLIIVIRNTLLGRSSLTEFNPMYTINTPTPPSIAFIQSPFFIFAYVGTIFSLVLAYKYLKLYLLKNNFKNKENGNKKLKKYMKTEDIPTKEEVESKFNKDKSKEKKKYYWQVARVAILLGILSVINYYYVNIVFLDIILTFSILSLFYRHIFVFHLDKKVLNKEWENNKIKKYMMTYTF